MTSYNNVKDIFINEEGLTFQADGKKLFLLVEPANYPKKHTEPAHKDDLHRIPYRFPEVETIVSTRQDRIMAGREPIIPYTSFTILKPTGHNFSYIFYETDDVLEAMQNFFKDTIWKDVNVPKIDAESTAKTIRKVFRTSMEYEIA